MISWNGFYKGINLGGWLSQCGTNYNKEHYLSFITKTDIEKIASWKIDHVRLPIDYNVIQNADGSLIEEGFSYIDHCIKWCEEFNLNVILDLHKTQGFVFHDKNCYKFFIDEELQKQFIVLWCEMAKRYGDKDNIAFELLNEVTSFEFAELWNKIISKTVPQIRKIAKNTKIIVGGIYNNSIRGISLLETPVDKNMVYTFHCYSPFVFTHQSASWVENMPTGFHIAFPKMMKEIKEASRSLFGTDFDSEFDGNGENELLNKEYFIKMFQPAIEQSQKYDIPIYCGEYGVIDRADTVSTLNWYKAIHDAFEECGIGRCAWTYQKMNFGIITPHYSDIYDDLIKLL